MNPTVSVVITTYNRANLLERALRSVLSQIYRDFEIIVVDDASTDDTQEILHDRFKQEIESGVLMYIRNEKNKERSYSRNRGMELSKGEYIALLDDDDIWLPDHLKVLTEFLKRNLQVAVVFSNIVNYQDDGMIKVIRPENLPTGSGRHYRELCIAGHLVSSPASLFRKAIINDIGDFKEYLINGEDWEFFSRIAMNYDVGYISRLTCLRYVHKGSYSASSQETGIFMERVQQIIEDNSIRYNFPISNSILAQKYLDISGTFIPYNFYKLRIYLLRSLRKNMGGIFHKNTWGLIIIAVLGKNFYHIWKKLKAGWH